MVLLDENKAISKIISTDVNDKKNYMGGTLLKKILINKSEIIIFEKRIFADEDNYINIFVYPIEHQIPNKDYLYWNHSIPLKYLSYPLFFQVKQDTIVNQFYNDVMNRIRYLHFYREKEFQKSVSMKFLCSQSSSMHYKKCRALFFILRSLQMRTLYLFCHSTLKTVTVRKQPGICKNTIYRMLHKRVLPSIPVLVEMCENLGCSLDFLLGLYSADIEAREAYVTTVLNIKAFWPDWGQEDRLALAALTSDLLAQSRKPVS